MAKPEEKHTIVEGDASKVPVQLAPGAAEPGASPERPTKGTQLLFGGKDPQSPWGQIAALIGEGGKVPYTLVNVAVLAKGQQQGKKPGSAPAKPKEEKKKDEPAGEPKELEVGPAAVEDIFIHGEEFDHAGKQARVWAHPETVTLGPRPLLVFLHGVQRPGDHPQLNEHFDGKTKNAEQLTHLGMLAKRLIAQRKVEPLIIAAPTSAADDGTRGNDLWTGFKLAAFIEDLRKVLDKHGLQIDDDEISVAGHSGAGCNSHGLLEVIAQGAKPGGHPLKVLGFADTCVNSSAGSIIAHSLKKLDPKTVLYSMHRGHGGGSQYCEGGAKEWAGYFNAKSHVDSPEYASGEGPEIADYRTDGQDPPKRFSLKMPAKPDVAHDTAVYTHQKDWYGSGAATEGVNTHYAMALNWTWYALQRFYPRVSPEASAELQVTDQAKNHKADLAQAGDDWAEVPAGPAPWQGGDARPRGNPPATFADPGSGRFWPVRTESSYGRAVAYIDEDGGRHGGGPAADPTAQRQFLSPRESAAGKWLNAGVDLYADFGDTVVAAEQGTIARFDLLWAGVWRLLVHCSSGLVICYGGLDPDSLTQRKLKVGDPVKAGQPIGKVGHPDDGQAMLHFETYPTGTPEPVPLWDKSLLGKVLDPTAYLLALAKLGQ